MRSIDSLTTIQPGWAVRDANGDKIGEVVQAGSNYLVLTKGTIFVHTLYVPQTAISDADETNNQVYLNVRKDEIDRLGWTELPGSASDRAETPADDTTREPPREQ